MQVNLQIDRIFEISKVELTFYDISSFFSIFCTFLNICSNFQDDFRKRGLTLDFRSIYIVALHLRSLRFEVCQW